MKNIKWNHILIFIIIILAVIFITKGFSDQNAPDPAATEVDLKKTFIAVDKQLDIMSLGIHQDSLYAGTPDGLFIVTGDFPYFRLEPVPLKNKLTYIRAICSIQGKLWIGGLEGLVQVDQDGSELLQSKASGALPDNRVNTIYPAPGGDVWVGTWGGAVCFSEKGKLPFVTMKTGLIKDMVNVILKDAAGTVWFASYNVREGGISRFQDGVFTHYTMETGLVNINTTSALFIDEDTLWFGSGMYEAGGITVFDVAESQPVKTYAMEDGFAGNKVRSLYITGNTLWIGSEYDGIAVWNDQKRIYTIDDGLTDNEVKCFLEWDGLVFLGTKAGLCYLNPEADIGVHAE